MRPQDAKDRQTLHRVLCLVALALLAGAGAFIYIRYGRSLWSLFKDVDRFKSWIAGFGGWSGVVFVAVRMVQTVVKIIPAEPLEIGSGLVFGAVGGMLLCLLGNILGSVVILFLTRRLGTRVLALFGLDQKLQSMRFLQDKERRKRLLLIFFLIPGTPKDGITWFVGLTDMDPVQFMVMTSFARIPSIISSTICGAFLGQKNWPLALGVFAATTALGLLGAFAYKKIVARYTEKKTDCN